MINFKNFNENSINEKIHVTDEQMNQTQKDVLNFLKNNFNVSYAAKHPWYNKIEIDIKDSFSLTVYPEKILIKKNGIEYKLKTTNSEEMINHIKKNQIKFNTTKSSPINNLIKKYSLELIEYKYSDGFDYYTLKMGIFKIWISYYVKYTIHITNKNTSKKIKNNVDNIEDIYTTLDKLSFENTKNDFNI